MGFNTTIFVLNDYWSDIRRDPEAWVERISAWDAWKEDRYIPGTTVMKTDHADAFRLYATQYNDIVELSAWSSATMEFAERRPEAVLRLIETAEQRLAELKKAILK